MKQSIFAIAACISLLTITRPLASLKEIPSTQHAEYIVANLDQITDFSPYEISAGTSHQVIAAYQDPVENPSAPLIPTHTAGELTEPDMFDDIVASVAGTWADIVAFFES